MQSEISANFVDDINTLRNSSKEFSCDIDLETSDGLELKNDNLEVDSKTVQSTGGICKFSNVRIKRSGSYIITISSSASAVVNKSTEAFSTSSSLLIVEIIPALSLSSYTAYFNYDFLVNLKGEQNFYYLESVTITLTMDDLSVLGGVITLQNDIGSFNFTNIYFKTSGSRYINANVTDPNNKETSESLNLSIAKLIIEIEDFTTVIIT